MHLVFRRPQKHTILDISMNYGWYVNFESDVLFLHLILVVVYHAGMSCILYLIKQKSVDLSLYSRSGGTRPAGNQAVYSALDARCIPICIVFGLIPSVEAWGSKLTRLPLPACVYRADPLLNVEPMHAAARVCDSRPVLHICKNPTSLSSSCSLMVTWIIFHPPST